MAVVYADAGDGYVINSNANFSTARDGTTGTSYSSSGAAATDGDTRHQHAEPTEVCC